MVTASAEVDTLKDREESRELEVALQSLPRYARFNGLRGMMALVNNLGFERHQHWSPMPRSTTPMTPPRSW